VLFGFLIQMITMFDKENHNDGNYEEQDFYKGVKICFIGFGQSTKYNNLCC